MNKYLFLLLAVLPLAAFGATPTKTPKDGYPRFALGADVSWLPYIETNRLHTYYEASEITTVPDMLTAYGIDAVRLRVWVDPCTEAALNGFTFKVDGVGYEEMSTYGTCSVDEMTALAARLAARGHRVMVSFQMSDQWADPARQFIPQAWKDCASADELADHAAAHVADVLQRLREANVNVVWAQIGNEVNNGMMEWEVPANGAEVTPAPYGCRIGQASPGVPTETTYNFVKVFSACAQAAEAVYPDIKIVLHLTHGAKWATLNWTLNLLKQAGFFAVAKCEYVGVSLYPGNENGRSDYTAEWQPSAESGLTTLANIYRYYGKRTLLCEIGMNNEYSLSTPQAQIDALGAQAAGIRQCNADVAAFTQYLIDNLGGDDSTCDGLFYWEPETDYMKDYTKGACVSVNPGTTWPRDKVTTNAWWSTVQTASTFPAGGLVDYDLNAGNTAPSIGESAPVYYNLSGIRVDSPTPGLYIVLRGPHATKEILPR